MMSDRPDQDDDIKVSAAQNSHFDFHKGPASASTNPIPTFETPDRVIVFTGDTGDSDALTQLAKGADLLVTETSSFQERMQTMIDSGQWQAMTPAQREGITRQAIEGHMTTEIIGKMATRANVKTVVLTHLPPRSASLPDKVRKHFSGQVLVAKDLMEF